jgi:uncharacterized damage-inducible protein DinB
VAWNGSASPVAAGTDRAGGHPRPLRAGPVAEEHHAAAEAAFLQQLEREPDVVGKSLVPAAHDDGDEEQMDLVDEPGLERLGGEVRAAHGEVAFRRRLQPPDRLGVEVPLDPRPGRVHRLQRPGVDDLAGRLPDGGEVQHDGRPVGEGLRVLPGAHHLVHPAPVEVGPNRPLEGVEEGVHLLVRRGPVEVAVLMLLSRRPDRLPPSIQRADGRWAVTDLDEYGRPEPPLAGDETATLLGFLEFQRATLAWKCGGLDAVGLRATVGASSMTLGGLLKHLAYVEDDWFSRALHGRDPAPPWDTVDWKADRDWDWHSAAEDSPEQLMALWQDAVARSRVLVKEALADGGLDRLARRTWPDGRAPSLRWILCHMIEEYARHNGHADLLRESVDGLVGE